MNIAMAAISQIMTDPRPGLPEVYEPENRQDSGVSGQPARLGVEFVAVCLLLIPLDSVLLGAGVPCGDPLFVV